MSYILKQEKRTRERVEAKLDRELIEQLERYCQYLESDRDYVIGKALEIAINKDKEFADWLKTQPATGAEPLPDVPREKRPGRRLISRASDHASKAFELTSPRGGGIEPQGR